MKIEEIEEPESISGEDWYTPRGEPGDRFFRFTTLDNETLVVAIPARAFGWADPDVVLGLNMVMAGHYE